MMIRLNSSWGEKKMITCLLVDCYEVEKKKRKEKERKKMKEKKKKKNRKWKILEKGKKKRSTINCANKSFVFWYKTWNERRSLIEILCLKLGGSNYSLRFWQVFVSISFRNYPLFVIPTTLQP